MIEPFIAAFPVDEMRKALRVSLAENDVSSELRPPQFTYVPSNHAKALNPETTIVEGMRGAGKSHWWLALSSKPHRQYIASAFPEAHLEENIDISQGYGLGLPNAVAPDKDTLGRLRSEFKPRHIWLAVVALHCEFPAPFPAVAATWRERVLWVSENSEQYNALLENAASDLVRKGRKRLILFDALDRLADDWEGIRPLTKALFQVALDMLATKAIRLKLFVRPDMLQDRDMLAFPDSSKLSARKVALTWARKDLYALLFQCLANDPENGSVFRKHVKTYWGPHWLDAVGVFALPKRLRVDEVLQSELFGALAGPAMAAGPHGTKKGVPYTWLPNHLVDGHDQVSPRSFFAALRSAAEMELPSWPYAIHFSGLKSGVQQASRIRVEEITQEDYPWVQTVMEPLKGLNVPFYDFEFTNVWEQRQTLKAVSLKMGTQTQGVKLLPAHYEQGEEGVLRDLKDLGVIHEMVDGRIQMPDVYRVAFGLGRKGGVKPLK